MIVSLDDILVDEQLNFVESPISILDKGINALHNKVVSLVKTQWQH